MSDLEMYPIAVVQDRYGGCYSKGEWLVISKTTHLENGAYRIIRCLDGDPHGEDFDAQLFWRDPPEWIAAGKTPEEAIANLRKKLGFG